MSCRNNSWAVCLEHPTQQEDKYLFVLAEKNSMIIEINHPKNKNSSDKLHIRFTGLKGCRVIWAYTSSVSTSAWNSTVDQLFKTSFCLLEGPKKKRKKETQTRTIKETHMHCNIVKLTDQLRRQVWIIGYVSIDFLVRWCCNLRRKRGFFKTLNHSTQRRNKKIIGICSKIPTCSLWPWGKYTTRLPTVGKDTRGPAQACQSSEFKHLLSPAITPTTSVIF